MNYNVDFFINDLSNLDINISSYQVNQFIKYYELLIDWNTKMNLTSITDFDEVIKKHFVDSVSILKYFDFKNEDKIIDVGTGAGFPGIPLKIMLPDCKFLLMDSLNKRIKFLSCVVDKLQLNNIDTCHSRAEDLALNEEYREQYDYVLSRAVANLSTLSEYCIPFLKIGGKFISYKSGEYNDELANSKNAINILGGKLDCIHSFVLPNSDISRSFISITKIKETGKKYPRKGALPKNKPL